ncbi:hypothetical protein B0919_01205 [Hymenobacter sp. CRA2]|nr:hypothetical protein B0919_01205 [Hymenobacter sp. CRA2]
MFQSYAVVNANGGGNSYLAGSKNADNAALLAGSNFGSFAAGSSLLLSGGEIKTYKNSGGDVTGAKLNYRVYRQDVAPGSLPAFTELDLPFSENLNGSGDQKWTNVNNAQGNNNPGPVNLLNGLNVRGRYVLEVYWRITTNLGDRFDSNFGNNFKATFDYTSGSLCGTYTIDAGAAASATNFASFGSAAAALNTNGVSCATTFNVAAGTAYTEKVVLGAISGASASSTITFQRAGSGANPRITAPGGSSSTVDAIVSLNGTDYVTFDGIDLLDPGSNNSTALQMEMGYALWRTGAGATADGCQNNIIKNCVVTMQRPLGTNANITGIYGANSTSANLTALGAAGLTPAATNSGNVFTNNTIEGPNQGISLLGIVDAAPYTYYDQGNNVGGTVAGTPGAGGSGSGNLLRNLNGIASGSNDIYGIQASNQNDLSVRYNRVDNAGGTGGSAAIRSLRGIRLGAGAAGTITLSDNAFTLNNTGSTTEIRGIEAAATGLALTTDNNVFTIAASSSATVQCFLFTNALASWAADGNVWDNNGIALSTTGTTYFVNNAATAATTPIITFTNNTVTNVNRTGTSGTFYGYYNNSGAPAASPAVHTITGNTISNITLAGSSIGYGIRQTAGAAIRPQALINGNVISNLSSATGSVYGINFDFGDNGGTNVSTISNNTISGLSSGVASGTGLGVFGIYAGTQGSTASNVTHVTISGNNISTLSNTGTATLAAINILGSPTQVTASSNVISGLSVGAASTAFVHGIYLAGATSATIGQNQISGISAANASSNIYGIRVLGGTTVNVTQNTVSGLNHTHTATGTAYGLAFAGGTTLNVTRNKVYDVASAAASATVYGMYALGTSSTCNFSNNLVGALRAPASTALNGLIGINLTAGTALNVYHNTVYLNGTSSGANFGSSALFAATSPLDLRNNVLVNLTTPKGTGLAVALRRAGAATSANLVGSTNNNLYYAGTPAATNLVYYDGTNADQTLASYQARMATLGSTPARESAAVTENPPFLSTTGADAGFLHINPAVPTQVESGGIPIGTVAVDFDGNARNATTPDIGADEGAFTPAAGMSISAVTYTQSGDNTTLNTTNQLVTSLNVQTTGSLNALTLNSLSIDLGSTQPADVSNARLYASTSATFSVASATLVPTSGSIGAPGYTLTLSTPATLTSGNNYYFLTYDIPGTATPGNTVASALTQVSVSGTAYNATLSGAAAARLILGPLNGTYLVGQGNAAPGYATITAALADLAYRGVGGPVTFSLTNPASTPYSAANGETFPLTIAPVAGASAANTVTFKPAAGVQPIISGSSGSSNSALLVLSGADYVTFDGANTTDGTTRDLTLTNTSVSTGTAVVWVASQGVGAGATNNTLKNLNLSGATTFTGTFGVFAGSTAGIGTANTGADNDALTMQNNAIQSVGYGIFAGGTANASAGGLDNLVVRDNTVGPATSGSGNIAVAGIYLTNAFGSTLTNGAQVSGNTVQNVATTTGTVPYGINLASNVPFATVQRNVINGVAQTGNGTDAYGLNLGSGVTDAVVDGNRVLNVTGGANGYSGHGIDVSPGSASSNLRLSNNVVAGIGGAGWTSLLSTSNAGITGIRLLGTTPGGISLYHNSVNLSGSFSSTSNALSAALYVGSGATGLDVRNNVLVNTLASPTAGATSKAYAFYSTAPAAAFTLLNYNDYFVSGTQGQLGNFGGTGTSSTSGTNVATLTALRTASGQDASSMTGAPGFTSATDLRPNPASSDSYNLNGTGVQLPAVSQDLSGTARPTTVAAGAPDLGAYEFTPTVQPNALTTTGSYAPGATQQFFFNNRLIASITYGTAGTLPTTLTARYYPGTNPRGPRAGTRYLNSYLELAAANDGADFTYDLTLYYDDALLGTVSPESSLRLSRRDPATGLYYFFEEATLDATANTLTQTGLTAFGEFTGSDIAAPLPVSLVAFEAQRQGAETLLTWTTAQEKNSRGFEVQVSADGRAYRPLDFVASTTPNASTARSYHFVDREAGKQGLRYYRLRQLDLTGEEAFFGPRTVQFGAAPSSSLSAHPNPFGQQLWLRLASPVAQPATLVRFYDLNGRLVLTRTVSVPAGSSELLLDDLGALPGGVYSLQLTLGGVPQRVKLVKP